MVDPIVIDLIQIDFGGRIVDIMLMWRIARPVPTRRVDLDSDQPVCGKLRGHHIDNLSGSIPAATQTTYAMIGSNEHRLELCCRRGTALGNFAECFSPECCTVLVGDI